MDPALVPEWTGELAQLRQVQAALARQVLLRDDFPRPLRTVAGIAVADADAQGGTDTVRAAAVLLDAGTLTPLARATHVEPARMPYLREFRSFRELPAMLGALARLPQAPDLLLVPAHGLAHPRRLGLASHLGLAAALPTIGVAERILLGQSSTTLHDMRGAFTTLRENRQQIGWLLRSQVGQSPLAVSPGHRVALASAPELVMRWVAGHRLPEPLRMAQDVLRDA